MQWMKRYTRNSEDFAMPVEFLILAYVRTPYKNTLWQTLLVAPLLSLYMLFLFCFVLGSGRLSVSGWILWCIDGSLMPWLVAWFAGGRVDTSELNNQQSFSIIVVFYIFSTCRWCCCYPGYPYWSLFSQYSNRHTDSGVPDVTKLK